MLFRSNEEGNPVLDIEAEAEIEPKFVPPENDKSAVPPIDGMEIHLVKIIVKGMIDLKRRRADQLVIKFEDNRGLDEKDTLMLVLTGLLPEDLLRLTGGGSGAAADAVLAPIFRELEAGAKSATGDLVQTLELASRLDSREVSVRVGTKALDGKLNLEASTDVSLDGASQTPFQAAIEARLKVTDELWVDLSTETEQRETHGAVRYRLKIPQD